MERAIASQNADQAGISSRRQGLPQLSSASLPRPARSHQTNTRRQMIISESARTRPQSNVHASLEIEA